MSNLKSELEKANRLLWTRKEQRAETEWRQREEAKQREAEIEQIIEAKVSQALRLMR